MSRLTMRQLSRETAAALDRVERGETLEVRRGAEVVARVVPVRADQERAEEWKAHARWLRSLEPGRRRPGLDPVDELVEGRRRRRGRE